MTRTFLTAAMLAATTFAAPSFAAEPIVGKWKRPSTGTLVQYSASGSSFCGKVLDGKHKGKSLGCLKGSGGKYRGEVVDVTKDKTYTGKAVVNGNSMKLSGCILRIACTGETWKRQ